MAEQGQRWFVASTVHAYVSAATSEEAQARLRDRIVGSGPPDTRDSLVRVGQVSPIMAVPLLGPGCTCPPCVAAPRAAGTDHL